MNKKVNRKKLTNLAMVNGNEKKYSIVIDSNTVKEWVGIGWIELREATDSDRETYPTVGEH